MLQKFLILMTTLLGVFIFYSKNLNFFAPRPKPFVEKTQKKSPQSSLGSVKPQPQVFREGPKAPERELQTPPTPPLSGSKNSQNWQPKPLKKNKTFEKLLKKTLSGHQRFLEKCFIKFYEKKGGDLQGGQLLTRVHLNEKGHLENIKILQSPYQQKAFHDCVKEVLSRVQFPKGQVTPHSFDLPIEIKLPPL